MIVNFNNLLKIIKEKILNKIPLIKIFSIIWIWIVWLKILAIIIIVVMLKNKNYLKTFQ